MRYDLKVKEKAIALRHRGKSYTQIQRELGLASKGTLSTWFKDLILPPSSVRLLEKNIERATEKGLLEFNTKRSALIQQENEIAYKEGKNSVNSLTPRELMLVGATLYWGEGTKRGGEHKPRQLVFTNSDPKMIQLFLRFLREILCVPEHKLAGELHLYENISHEEAKKYWSEITGIRIERFWSTNLVSKASQGKRPFTRLRYGTAAIRICDRKLFNKVMGMIEGLTASES